MPGILFCVAVSKRTSTRTGLSLPFNPPPKKSWVSVYDSCGWKTWSRKLMLSPPATLADETLFPLWVAINSSMTFPGTVGPPYKLPGCTLRDVVLTQVCVMFHPVWSCGCASGGYGVNAVTRILHMLLDIH